MGQRNTIGQSRDITKRRRRRETPPDRNTTRQSKSSAKKMEQFKSETQQEMQVMAEI